MKRFNFLLILLFAAAQVWAQDAIIFGEGNFERGTIQGTDYVTVALQKDDNTIKVFTAKDIESFIWNGDTYVSKPYIFGKIADVRFFRLIEAGTVNLFAYGQPYITEQLPQAQTGPRVQPNVGMGLGAGGGMGGGISIDLSRRRNATAMAPRKIKSKVFYFLEKPGTGPMAQLTMGNSKLAATKSLLLQKLNKDEAIADQIKAIESFDEKNVTALLKSYNETHKSKIFPIK